MNTRRFEEKACDRQTELFGRHYNRSFEKIFALDRKLKSYLDKASALIIPDGYLAYHGLVDDNVRIGKPYTNIINLNKDIMEENKTQEVPQEVLEGVKEIYSSQLGVEKVLDTDTVKDLGGDSLDTADIVIGIEKRFGIRISDAEAGVMQDATVLDQAIFVASKIGTKEGK